MDDTVTIRTKLAVALRLINEAGDLAEASATIQAHNDAVSFEFASATRAVETVLDEVKDAAGVPVI